MREIIVVSVELVYVPIWIHQLFNKDRVNGLMYLDDVVSNALFFDPINVREPNKVFTC